MAHEAMGTAGTHRRHTQTRRLRARLDMSGGHLLLTLNPTSAPASAPRPPDSRAAFIGPVDMFTGTSADFALDLPQGQPGFHVRGGEESIEPSG